MALANGVLVHGPTSWACAVRTDDGRLKVVAERKRIIGSGIESPLLRGPARLAEAFAFLPRAQARAARGEAAVRAPARARRRCSRSAVVAPRRPPDAARRRARRSSLAGAARARAGAALAARGRARRLPRRRAHRDRQLRARRAARAGARALRLAPGRPAARDDRRGQPARRARAAAAPRPAARLAATLGAVAAATEIFGWMQRNPDQPLARALARPGPRAPAPGRDRRADAGAARGRRGGAPRLPRARRAAPARGAAASRGRSCWRRPPSVAACSSRPDAPRSGLLQSCPHDAVPVVGAHAARTCGTCTRSRPRCHGRLQLTARSLRRVDPELASRREPPLRLASLPVDARGIHHLGVAVDDLDEALERYRTLFGAELEHRQTVRRAGRRGRVAAGRRRAGRAARARSGPRRPSAGSSPRAGPGCTTSPSRSTDVGGELDAPRGAAVPS